VLIEDSLIYLLPEESYKKLRSKDRDFDRFFHSQRDRRIRRAGRYEPNPSEMLRSIKVLMSGGVLTTSPQSTIIQAANEMSSRRVSSILIMEDDELVGIVTDRDIRSRAVAQNMEVDSPVSDIMSPNPRTILPEETLFDATLFMTRYGVHHIPVVESSGQVIGIVTASDLMLAKQDDPVFIVQHISRQDSLEGLKAIVDSLPSLLSQWVSIGIRAHQISHILTAVSDAVTHRLIKMFIAEHGEAPVPFCWLGFGSQGREEQLLGADQDNGLLISDSVLPEHDAWFSGLARFVCSGLDACGYVYCPGGIMAMTDQWRQPLREWKHTIDGWTVTPTSDALMRVSIFFDLRAIYGDKSLCDQLQQHMLQKASGSSLFLACLAESVLDVPPPLGLFRRFVVDRNGEHKDQLNLKKCGVMPIVDIARIFALANNITAVNTNERLKQLAENKSMTISTSRNLKDALRFIMQTRVNQQSEQINRGLDVSNYLNPDDFSKLIRSQLKDAFAIISDAQVSVKMNYRPGM